MPAWQYIGHIAFEHAVDSRLVTPVLRPEMVEHRTLDPERDPLRAIGPDQYGLAQNAASGSRMSLRLISRSSADAISFGVRDRRFPFMPDLPFLAGRLSLPPTSVDMARKSCREGTLEVGAAGVPEPAQRADNLQQEADDRPENPIGHELPDDDGEDDPQPRCRDDCRE